MTERELRALRWLGYDSQRQQIVKRVKDLRFAEIEHGDKIVGARKRLDCERASQSVCLISARAQPRFYEALERIRQFQLALELLDDLPPTASTDDDAVVCKRAQQAGEEQRMSAGAEIEPLEELRVSIAQCARQCCFQGLALERTYWHFGKSRSGQSRA